MNIIERWFSRWRTAHGSSQATTPRIGAPDNGILISLSYIEDDSYGEYAGIRGKVLHLAGLLTKKQKMPVLSDGSLLEYDVSSDRISLRNASAARERFPTGTYRQYTYVDLCPDGKISFSLADGNDLHELMLRPDGHPSYCNGRYGEGDFPSHSLTSFLDKAIEAASAA